MVCSLLSMLRALLSPLPNATDFRLLFREEATGDSGYRQQRSALTSRRGLQPVMV